MHVRSQHFRWKLWTDERKYRAYRCQSINLTTLCNTPRPKSPSWDSSRPLDLREGIITFSAMSSPSAGTAMTMTIWFAFILRRIVSHLTNMTRRWSTPFKLVVLLPPRRSRLTPFSLIT
ncbi:hypothetical protein BS17DRAFT_123993 [Gyrodon lividus]|nr:hypothetical protein BS17DRAFT_123993 [Gyrodon lividus]